VTLSAASHSDVFDILVIFTKLGPVTYLVLYKYTKFESIRLINEILILTYLQNLNMPVSHNNVYLLKADYLHVFTVTVGPLAIRTNHFHITSICIVYDKKVFHLYAFALN